MCSRAFQLFILVACTANRHPFIIDRLCFSECQGYQLAFPSWHDMLRWDAGSGHRTLQPNLVGRYNETVLLQTLPQPLQTQDLHGAFLSIELHVCDSDCASAALVLW